MAINNKRPIEEKRIPKGTLRAKLDELIAANPDIVVRKLSPGRRNKVGELGFKQWLRTVRHRSSKA